MDQRFRVLQGGPPKLQRRAHERRPLRVTGRMVWKDARGATRLARITTRDVSELGMAIECDSLFPIPVYRLVRVQVDWHDRGRPDLPECLRRESVLAAVYRVEPVDPRTGLPSGYALRLLVDPRQLAASGEATTCAGR